MIVQPLELISCRLINLTSSTLSEHFWEVHCTATWHACSSTVRVSVHPQTAWCLVKNLFHYLHHCPIRLLHVHFGTQHVTYPCACVCLALMLSCQTSIPGCCSRRWKKECYPGESLAGVWYWLLKQLKKHWLYEVIGKMPMVTSSADGRQSFLKAA